MGRYSKLELYHRRNDLKKNSMPSKQKKKKVIRPPAHPTLNKTKHDAAFQGLHKHVDQNVSSLHVGKKIASIVSVQAFSLDGDDIK